MESRSSSRGAFFPTETLCRNSHAAEPSVRWPGRWWEIGTGLAWSNIHSWLQKLHYTVPVSLQHSGGDLPAQHENWAHSSGAAKASWLSHPLYQTTQAWTASQAVPWRKWPWKAKKQIVSLMYLLWLLKKDGKPRHLPRLLLISPFAASHSNIRCSSSIFES